jgi:hypothetical protein
VTAPTNLTDDEREQWALTDDGGLYRELLQKLSDARAALGVAQLWIGDVGGEFRNDAYRDAVKQIDAVLASTLAPGEESAVREAAVKSRPTTKYCTCEGPFGCQVHDPNVDGLTSLDGLPPHRVLDVVRRAVVVAAQLQQCNGEVYAVECTIADELVDALRRLASARGVA